MSQVDYNSFFSASLSPPSRGVLRLDIDVDVAADILNKQSTVAREWFPRMGI